MLADTISAEFLTKTIEHYLADEPQAVAVEDGEVLFNFGTAKYSISGEGKCVLTSGRRSATPYGEYWTPRSMTARYACRCCASDKRNPS